MGMLLDFDRHGRHVILLASSFRCCPSRQPIQ